MTNAIALSSENGLQHYLHRIHKIPLLTEQEEVALACRWNNEGDVEAAHRLVTSHLRLVVKLAMGYRGYGLPLMDLISEGSVGLMKAVKKFDPEKGYRLATYAMWWIRASMQEYVLKSWSLVKIGTTAAQKKLFFNLKRLKSRLHTPDDRSLRPEHVTSIARELVVSEKEVQMMNQRLLGADSSLNVPLGAEEGAEHLDNLMDKTPSQERLLSDREESSHRQQLLQKAMLGLKERERSILSARRLAETPRTLDELSREYGVSRERVRQIENRAFEKLQSAVCA